MANILRPTPEESRRMAIRANQITERCADCGEAYHRGNLLPTKAHGLLCSDCFDDLFNATLRRAGIEV